MKTTNNPNKHHDEQQHQSCVAIKTKSTIRRRQSWISILIQVLLLPLQCTATIIITLNLFLALHTTTQAFGIHHSSHATTTNNQHKQKIWNNANFDVTSTTQMNHCQSSQTVENDTMFGVSTAEEEEYPNQTSAKQKKEYYLTQLTNLFQSSLSKLLLNDSNSGNHMDEHTIQHHSQRYAQFVYESMSNRGRYFHNVQHVLNVLTPYFQDQQQGPSISDNNNNSSNVIVIPNDDPLLILSVLFHDVVYYTIDHGGVSKDQMELLQELIIAVYPSPQDSYPTEVYYTLSPKIWSSSSAPLFRTIAKIYGYNDKDDNDHDNNSEPLTNEFLSALCAAKLLQNILSDSQILEIVIAIAATIPFQPILHDKGPLDRLFDRLVQLLVPLNMPQQEEPQKQQQQQQLEKLLFTQDQCHKAVQRAAKLASWDLGNLATPSFLDFCYTLIPETNRAFQKVVAVVNPQDDNDDCIINYNYNYNYHTNSYSYTFYDYYKAIYGQYKFFHFLTVEHIFPTFGGIPANVQELETLARRNFRMGVDYMACKVLSASILCALEELTSTTSTATTTTTATKRVSSSSGSSVAEFFGISPTAVVDEDHNNNDINNQFSINLLPTVQPTRSSSSDDTTTNNNNDDEFDWEVYEHLNNGPPKSQFIWFDIPQSQLATNLYVTLGRTQIHKLVQEYCCSSSSSPSPFSSSSPTTNATKKEKDNRLELLHALPQSFVQDLIQRLIHTIRSKARADKFAILLQNEFHNNDDTKMESR